MNNSRDWKQECDSEINAMKSLKVYELVETPKNRKTIETRWV